MTVIQLFQDVEWDRQGIWLWYWEPVPVFCLMTIRQGRFQEFIVWLMKHTYLDCMAMKEDNPVWEMVSSIS